MAVCHVNLFSLFCCFLFSLVGSFPKLVDGDQESSLKIPVESPTNKNVKVFHLNANHIPDLVKAFKDKKAENHASSELMDRLIPDHYKIMVVIRLKEPMLREEVIQGLRKKVAHLAQLDLDNVKVSKYEPENGIVKMVFLHPWEKDEKDLLKFRSTTEILPHLVGKRLENTGGSIKILDVRNGNDYYNRYSGERKLYEQTIFSNKNWEAWQLAVIISVSLIAIFCVFIVIMFVSARRLPRDKAVEEPRRVVVQPVLSPAVGGAGGVQPGSRDHRAAGSDSEPSPSRSPMRMKGRGLLERRGSNASLTLDLNRSQENISCGTPPKECSTEEYLQSASKRVSRRQLRCSLKDVKALHTEFWEIPMNHPEKVEIAGCGTKNRYKTILPNENTRVHLYETNEDPLSSYINANYIRGYSGEANAYIATQGPLPHTVSDFWQMVWKEQSHEIVMITKLKEKMKIKCEPYIPDYQGYYDDIEVTVIRVIPREGYTIRELFVKRGSETRTIHHFWYTTWPDHKTPQTAKNLLSMVLEVEALRHNTSDDDTKGPMIVHCSAGIGRTGCFIAASIGIQQLLEENSVDILGIVCSLRIDRGGMIQTAEQYEFIHQALKIFELTLPEEGD